MTPKKLIWSVIGGFIAIALVTRIDFLNVVMGSEFRE